MRIQKVLSEGIQLSSENFVFIFLLFIYFVVVFYKERGGGGPNTTTSGGLYRPAGVPMMANIECWLGSFVIFPDHYC